MNLYFTQFRCLDCQKEFVLNSNISLGAKGLWAVLAFLYPPEQEILIDILVMKTSESSTTIQRYLDELLENKLIYEWGKKK
jgi:hypothetical protein